MKKLFSLLLMFTFLSQTCFGWPGNIEVDDGTTKVRNVKKLIFSGATAAKSGSNGATVTVAAGITVVADGSTQTTECSGLTFNADDFDATTTNNIVTISATAKTELSIVLSPQSAKLPSSNPAVIDGSGNNWLLLFDDTTDESGYWQTVLDDDFDTANTVYADIYFSMASATSGSVVWNISIMAVTAGDSADVNTESFDTVNAVTEAVPGTAGYLDKATITLSNKDSWAAGDYVKFKAIRDADNGSDTASGDAEILKIVIRE